MRMAMQVLQRGLQDCMLTEGCAYENAKKHNRSHK